MKGKIIQIIPNNNKELYAYCENDEKEADNVPLVCFALVEYYDQYSDETYRVIEPMFLSYQGEVSTIKEAYCDFKEIRGFNFDVYKVNEK